MKMQPFQTNTAEISQFDRCFEGYRIQNKVQEQGIRESVRLNGILEPLEVIEKDGKLVLLNGFKRIFAAQKLGIHILPWISIGKNEIEGVVNLIRQSNSKRLNILEEAKFLKSLTQENKKSYAEISCLLDKSVSWISMRIQLLKGLDKDIEAILFSGTFPVYAYMYILRPFIRMKGISQQEIRELVKLLSGQNLSVRQIEYLAEAWFRGPETVKEQLRAGQIKQVLKWIQKIAQQDTNQCTEQECRMLRMLEMILEYMKQFLVFCENEKLKSNSYRCQAHYLTNAILSKSSPYLERMKIYHDHLGQKTIDLSAISTRT